jgi:hypothetical protein
MGNEAMSGLLEDALGQFRDLVNSHPRMTTLLRGWDRVTVVEAEDTGAQYTIDFRDCQIVSVTPGKSQENVSIYLKASERILADVFAGALNPASEFLDGRLRVDAVAKDQVKLDAITLVLWD